MKERQKLLLVEDESHLAAGLKLNFEFEGFDVDIAGSIREANLFLDKVQRYTAIILDITLPDGDGFALCRKLRSSGNYTPVLMLTARGQARDRVDGLRSGADDYLTKPFDLDELLARVRSILRRRAWDQAASPPQQELRFGEASIDFSQHMALNHGKEVHLTALEMDLLRYFAANQNRVLTREELLAEVWQMPNYPNTRTVDNFVMRLRRQFEPNPTSPIYFLSIRGRGYKFISEGLR
jgi:DNA-binding response OmpR family regulator